MPTKPLPIYELQVGMYVAKLDLSWLRSPFLRHRFLVERPSQIERLIRGGVRTVHIDPDRGIDAPRTSSSTRPEPPFAPTRIPPAPAAKSLAQLNEEYAQAKLAKERLNQAVHSVFSTVIDTGTIDANHAAESVQEIAIAMRTIPAAAIFMAVSQDRAGDSSLSQHAMTTCTLSLVLGQALNLNPLELQQLATAALLHDIGLLQLPPRLVQRASTTSPPLSQSEARQYHTHPRLGILMLERHGRFDTPILHLMGEHHVYLDGSGYPPETRGEFTSQRTRMLIIADKYDELISGFGGASPLVPHQALQRLYQEAQEGRIDQRILSQFIKTVGIYPVHSTVQLNTKEFAVVTNLHPATLHQPIVTVTHDPHGVSYPTPFVIDLASQHSHEEKRFITSVLETLPQSCLSGA